MRFNRLHLLLPVFLWMAFSCQMPIAKRSTVMPGNTTLAPDTTGGFFFYEIDAPAKCYTRFDQIEQGNRLIFFDSLIGSKEIGSLYAKGVFVLSYEPLIARVAENQKRGIAQNKEKLAVFDKSINPRMHQDEETYQREIYLDKHNALKYKKVFLRFSFVSLGRQTQLVPQTRNYACCYSNTTEEIPTFFITDIFEYKLY